MPEVGTVRYAAVRRRWPVPSALRVLAAFRAEALRAFAVLRPAAVRAWRDRAFFDAARCGSRFRAASVARDRRGDGRVWRWPARFADAALCLVRSVAEGGGEGSFTPARRAFDKPIAIACFVEAAPCLPSRTWWISSRTNSPAWVDGARPARFNLRARLTVCFSGMVVLPDQNGSNADATDRSSN